MKRDGCGGVADDWSRGDTMLADARPTLVLADAAGDDSKAVNGRQSESR